MPIPSLALVAALAACWTAPDGDASLHWPQFLGPRGTAVARGAVATLEFDLDRDVLWRTDLPRGSSSPCVAGDRIFLTGAAGDELFMMAFDRRSGAELWRRSVSTSGTGPAAHVDKDPAAPSACTDGQRVVFYFGGYGLIAFDPDGSKLWERALPVPEAAFGVGSSPILVDDSVLLLRDGCPDSGLHAFSKHDGSPRWSVPRFGNTFSHCTPFVWTNSERRELVIAGTQRLSGLDLADGDELWHIDGLFAAWSTPDADQGERSAVSFGTLTFTDEQIADGQAVFDAIDRNRDGRIEPDEIPESRAKDAFAFIDVDGDGAWSTQELVPQVQAAPGNGRNLLVAVRAGGDGDVASSHVRWTYRRGLPYVASPLLHEGRLYLLKAGGMVTCLDPETGRAHYVQQRLGDRSEYYASPVGVDGHVVICSSGGTIYVLRSADELDVVRSVDLGERIIATPAIVDGTIYVRTSKALWAFGRRADAG
jgi:outer membrane protein assembly factor BamB